jgi:opacity protein-like surface antigen
MQKLLIAVIVVFVLSFGCFAASLDDPVPQTPTIRSELQAGYNYAKSIFNSNSMYDAYTVYKIIKYESRLIDRDKSQAYQLGYYIGCRYLAFKNYRNDKNVLLINMDTLEKITPLYFSTGITTSQVCECLGISAEEL